MNLKIGLDLDDTIFSFVNYYVQRFGKIKSNNEITKNVYRILSKDKNWWLNQPLINYPNFNPTLYCTKRIHNKAWTKLQLQLNNLPLAPIYQVYSQTKNKADVIKGRIDVFIDDSINNMIAMNLANVPCLLLDTPNNQEWGPIGKVYSLDKEEIEEVYYLFKNTIYNNFKELV